MQEITHIFCFFILKNTLFLPRLNFYTINIYRAREKNQVYMCHLMEGLYDSRKKCMISCVCEKKVVTLHGFFRFVSEMR